MKEDKTKPNPNWTPAKDGETIGVGLWGERTCIDKWDAKSKSVIRKWSDGTMEVITYPDTPPKLPDVCPIFYKREIKPE